MEESLFEVEVNVELSKETVYEIEHKLIKEIVSPTLLTAEACIGVIRGIVAFADELLALWEDDDEEETE